MELNTVIFWTLGLFVLATSIMAVTDSRLLNSALYLALSFFLIGFLFFTLGNGFLAVLQILINAGAIPIVTVFIIFMTQSRRIKLRSQLNVFVAIGAVVLLGASLWAFWNTARQTTIGQAQSITATDNKELGRRLLSAESVNGTTGTLFAFEVASVLLLVAMTGAIVLTKREGETIKGQVGVLSEIDKPVTAGALERPAKPLESAEKGAV